MDLQQTVLEGYTPSFNFENIEEEIAKITSSNAGMISDKDTLKQILNCIDNTTLKETDSTESVIEFLKKVNNHSQENPDIPNVAAVCLFPVFAPTAKEYLKAEGVNKAVVAGGFPASQTFLEIKEQEIKKAVAYGVDEVDIVISVGEFLAGNYEFVFEEIVRQKAACGDAHLKVILETGAIKDPKLIWQASIIAMEAGADFIKTSTGKIPEAATLPAAYVMCQAIKAFNEKHNKKIGFKPAGGISTTDEAVKFFAVVKEILGEKWMNNKMFRIGASRLVNNLISDIKNLIS